MGRDDKKADDIHQGNGRITRRRFMGTSGRFLIYTSPVLTTLLTADRAAAVSVDPYFTVEARNAEQGTFTGMPATGSPGATSTSMWNVHPAVDEVAVVSYQRYFIGINGSGPHMPTQSIQVIITWELTTGHGGDIFRWGPGPDAGSTQTVTVPVGGGTLGVGGTIVDSGEVNWPHIQIAAGYTGNVGTVTFKPTGTGIGRLKTLTLRIIAT